VFPELGSASWECIIVALQIPMKLAFQILDHRNRITSRLRYKSGIFYDVLDIRVALNCPSLVAISRGLKMPDLAWCSDALQCRVLLPVCLSS
jgi:hypothetical protein